ncbi:hypothetical protein COCON_G00215240 [Conger conger]|uniref:Uncharacterized protein n=1 Tax=Conger conger TaxID=82655 RepID=A0A9Q1HMC6_CONCO|nr:hypothetical protein COCON_G00215240 [Conger conger]
MAFRKSAAIKLSDIRVLWEDFGTPYTFVLAAARTRVDPNTGIASRAWAPQATGSTTPSTVPARLQKVALIQPTPGNLFLEMPKEPMAV